MTNLSCTQKINDKSGRNVLWVESLLGSGEDKSESQREHLLLTPDVVPVSNMPMFCNSF